MTPDQDPWLRQKGEHEKSYSYFCIFRDLAPEKRNYKDVAKEAGKTERCIQGHAANNHWVERVRAYDNYVQEGHIRKNMVAIDEMNKRQAEDAMKIQEQAMYDFQNVIEDERSKASVESRKKAAVQTWKIGVDAERLARGVATEKVEQDGRIRQEHSGTIGFENDLLRDPEYLASKRAAMDEYYKKKNSKKE